MKSRTKLILTLLLTTGVLFGLKPNDLFAQAAGNAIVRQAVFSGGCFWGVDAVFKHVKGVTRSSQAIPVETPTPHTTTS